MVDKEVKECREKFYRVLEHIEPKEAIKDDTFLEKMQTYLSQAGMSINYKFLIFEFHNFIDTDFFLFCFQQNIANL